MTMRPDFASLREFVGPVSADPTDATVPIAKATLRELLDAIEGCDRTNQESLAEIQRLEGEAIIAAEHIRGAEAAIERLATENGKLRHRWKHAEPFVNAAIDLYNEALQDSFPSGVPPAYDRRTVTAALAPAMNGLMALHETLSDEEINEQLRAAGGDPVAIGERGKAKILALLQKRREARR